MANLESLETPAALLEVARSLEVALEEAQRPLVAAEGLEAATVAHPLRRPLRPSWASRLVGGGA